jgi:RNA recognition motif-containing protein
MAKRPNTSSTAGPIPAAPRGPPRKPKQSGHALWVGNLPVGANVSDLKDHFSKEATQDIESVFLISKSNCAFVNYRTESTCAAAMARFHESRFQGVRLVCRLRRTPAAPNPIATTNNGANVPTGPSALSANVQQSQTAVEAINQNREISSKAEESMRQLEGASKINDKYFIVKSLTLEDLELSARNGIWATQSHNEAALNRAFEVKLGPFC